MCKNLLVKYMVWCGKAINIGINNDYPADVLSNLSDNAFLFDGIPCGSMEGFLQSLRHGEPAMQRRVCLMDGRAARQFNGNLTGEQLWWKGRQMRRNSRELNRLVADAYKAMFIQNYDFQTALLTTFGKRLYYSTEVVGNGEPVISDRKICNILCDLRDKSQEILIDAFSARDRYLGDAAERLVHDAINLVDDLSREDSDKKTNIVSVSSDQSIFYNDYLFCIGLSSTDMKFHNNATTKINNSANGNNPIGKLWLMEVAVSNGSMKYKRALDFGTTDMLQRKLHEKHITDSVRTIILDGVTFLKN